MKKYNLRQLRAAVSKSYSFSEVVSNLPIRYGGDTIKKVREEIQSLNIDTSHFGKRTKRVHTRKTVFSRNSKASSQTMKRWYLKSIPKARHKCAFCDVVETY